MSRRVFYRVSCRVFYRLVLPGVLPSFYRLVPPVGSTGWFYRLVPTGWFHRLVLPVGSTGWFYRLVPPEGWPSTRAWHQLEASEGGLLRRGEAILWREVGVG